MTERRTEQNLKPKDFSWPVITSKNITIGEPKSNIAIATLWTPRERIIQFLPKNQFAIVGQQYEKWGISLTLRNLLANPHIRYLIVCGADLSESGEALVRVWQDGINGDHKIPGIENAAIQKEIPREAIERLRSGISLIDLRETKDRLGQKVQETIARLPKLPPWGNPEVYPVPKLEATERMPSEPSSHIVRGKTIGEAWLKILREIMLFGEDAGTNYGNTARDLSNLVAVVTNEDPQNPQMEPFFNFTKKDLEEYVQEFFSLDCPEGVFYIYGERIHAFGSQKVNQADIILDKLRRKPNDRGAVAILYDPIKDNQIGVENPVPEEDFRNPCLVFLQAEIKSNGLNLTAFFRSHDMYGAWPRNAFGLRRLQYEWAKKLNQPLGWLTTVSMRAHIYQESWPDIEGILKHYGPRSHRFEPDPRGNYRIGVEGGKILITHQDPEKGPLRPTEVLDGTKKKAALAAAKLFEQRSGFSSTMHAADIGIELVIAEICAKTGIPFVQDSAGKVIREIVRRLKEHK